MQRHDLASAIHHWGQFGDGGEPGLRLTEQASALVEVLACMDLAHEQEVLLPACGRLAELVQQARTALRAPAAEPAEPTRTGAP